MSHTLPTNQLLRELMLDYLVHNAYIGTARAFAEESIVRHLDADGDEVPRPAPEADSAVLSEDLVAQAQLRHDVQDCILSGRIDDAIAQLNTHFPAVLDASSPDITRVSSSTDVAGKASAPPSIRMLIPYTVDPARLFLELRILAFIEAARTVPLAPTTPTPKDTPARTEGGDARENDDAHLAALLQHVFALNALVKALPDAEDRADYEREMARISLLLAHRVPEASPVARYLAQARREDVAKQIACAMLYRAGLSPVSRLEMQARQMCAVWGYMADHRFPPPPAAKVPEGLRLPTPRPPRDIDDNEPVQPFSLSQFFALPSPSA